ncbi:hypothetical protein IG626_11355 [Desulfovibrio desulfuricans]|uniref:hypothetical protein n=1 Tax=Desulfovibrio desulfuricans TaxID=876 RepID=UPI001784B7EF|nr:hypothetical protein [Desulfovibrio desulfuricans]MBD8896591.1 hypothetical protein [Desulfovibrio desulfuricans]
MGTWIFLGVKVSAAGSVFSRFLAGRPRLFRHAQYIAVAFAVQEHLLADTAQINTKNFYVFDFLIRLDAANYIYPV